MKIEIISLLVAFFVCQNIFAQTNELILKDSILNHLEDSPCWNMNHDVWNYDLNKDSICKERGHIESFDIQTTLLNCEDDFITNDSFDIVIRNYCNTSQYKCKRCDSIVIIPPKTYRDTIYRKL